MEEKQQRNSDTVIERLASDFHDFVRESKRDRIERDRKIACLHEGFESFRKSHEPLLQQIAEADIRRKKIREAIVDKVASSVIWAALVGIGSAIWFWVKANFKG